MSADGVNNYVKSVVVCTMELPVLLRHIDRQLSSAKTRGGKNFLSELREVCLYAVPGQLLPSAEYALGLMRMVEDSHDPDMDKKALRVCYFLLFEYLYSNHISETNFQAVLSSLVSYLQRTAIGHLQGGPLCLAWRHLGRVGKLVLMLQGASSAPYAEISDTMRRSMRTLKYPEKKKGFMGREVVSEAYEAGLHVWTAVFSAMRRADNPPTKDEMIVVFQVS
jgi:hypothetical protein